MSAPDDPIQVRYPNLVGVGHKSDRG